MKRACIGTCSGPSDATLVRAAFEAHDLPVVINAEQHASMLGGLGGGFTPLYIYVDEQDAEEAAELLRDLREQDHTQAAHEDAASPTTDEPDDPEDVARARKNVRRRVVVWMLGGLVLFPLAAPFAIGRPWLIAVIVGAYLAVLAGSMYQPKTRAQPLPRARLAKR